MPVLDEYLALQLVERGAQLLPLDRAVLLLSMCDGIDGDAACQVPLDQRDRRLLDVRIASFGPHVSIFARCSHCKEAHEAEFDLRVLPQPSATEAVAVVEGHEVRLRAPTSQALADAARTGRPAALADACVTGAPFGADAAFDAAVERSVASAFPLLDVRLSLLCGACAENFDVRFDIVAWLWNEIEGVATRAIDSVDRLARAYGWSERDILGLSPARRALYLAKAAG